MAKNPNAKVAHISPKSDELFVGRQEEMLRLQSALEDSISGAGRLVMLAGEPGIGKSRTAEEFAELGKAQNAAVLWGRCYEGDGAPLYWPWIQVVRAYLGLFAAAEIRAQMGTGAAAIAEMVPHVREHLSDIAPLKPIEDPVSARFRLFDSVNSFFKAASAVQPLMIVLDDLHWSDGPSLLLLEFLAHELRESRLLILGT